MQLKRRWWLNLWEIGLLCLAYYGPMQDVDLGWHLRYGQYFWQTGQVLKQNSFSYWLPDYVWPNHSWGYDVLIYPLYARTGLTGLAWLAALIAGLGWWLIWHRQTTAVKLWGWLISWWLSFFLLGQGLKSQLLSWFVWVCLAVLLRQMTTWRWWWLPLIFLLWSNLHGQFVLGLGLVWLFIFLSDWSQTHDWQSVINRRWRPLAATALALVVNPYGWQVLRQSFVYLNSSVLQQVSEWRPWPHDSWLWYLVVITWLMAWWGSNKLTTHGWAVRLWLLLLGYWSWQARRMIPWLLVVSLPLAVNQLARFFSQRWPRLAVRRYNLMLVVLLLGGSWGMKWRTTQWRPQTWQDYCATEIACSVSALQFLKQHRMPGQMLNPYRWGGWLIWHYPEKPVWIDGRMTLWQDRQGQYLMPQYRAVIDAQPGVERQLDRWQFGFALLHPGYPLTRYLAQVQAWPVVYQDQTSVILVNPRFYDAFANSEPTN